MSQPEFDEMVMAPINTLQYSYPLPLQPAEPVTVQGTYDMLMPVGEQQITLTFTKRDAAGREKVTGEITFNGHLELRPHMNQPAGEPMAEITINKPVNTVLPDA